MVKVAVIKVVLCYLLLVNVGAFFVYGLDKWIARRNGNANFTSQLRRISEKALFRWAIFGGALGAYAGMKIWRHKTKHWYFVWGIPAIGIFEIALVLFLIWLIW